jgi:hypothetical protein
VQCIVKIHTTCTDNCIQVLPLQVHKNKPVYNHLQSSNAGDGQSFQSKYVHTEEVKQTARE